METHPERTQWGSLGGAVCCLCYLEGVFVDEDVQSSLDLLGFAEEDELLKQEDVTLTLPPSCPDSELVLTDQLTLLLQVHLDGGGVSVSWDLRAALCPC